MPAPELPIAELPTRELPIPQLPIPELRTRELPTAGLWAWPALCALLGAASVAVWLLGGPAMDDTSPAARLVWQPGSWWQRPWTLWTAPLVHLSGVHLAANALALAALAVLGRMSDRRLELSKQQVRQNRSADRKFSFFSEVHQARPRRRRYCRFFRP